MSAAPETVAGCVPVRMIGEHARRPIEESPRSALRIVREGCTVLAVDPALWARYTAVRAEYADLINRIERAHSFALALVVDAELVRDAE